MDRINARPVWVSIAVWITLLAAIGVLLAGPANRLGILDWMSALTLLRYASVVAGAGAALCLVAAFVTRPNSGRRGFGLAVAAIIAGAAAFAIPVMLLQTAKRVPPIHDISTDTENPPQFVAVLPIRANAANPPEYAGAEVAAQQRAAYPDIRTVMTPVDADKLYARTLDAMKELGWEIVATVPAEGRIEATDTTTWFGFKDDIVVRITPTDEGAAIDVRSKSRVGMSDLGANAARIRKLLGRVQAG